LLKSAQRPQEAHTLTSRAESQTSVRCNIWIAGCQFLESAYIRYKKSVDWSGPDRPGSIATPTVMSGRNRAKSGFIPLPATSSLYAGSAPTSKPKQTQFCTLLPLQGQYSGSYRRTGTNNTPQL